MSVKIVKMDQTVSAYDAAKYLGCSYPHLIHIIKKNKLRAQKVRKQWYVDLEDLRAAKKANLVTPRPRVNSENNKEIPTIFASMDADAIDVKIRMSKELYEKIKDFKEEDEQFEYALAA